MYWNKRIKDLREDNDLTKQELADKLDISELDMKQVNLNLQLVF